MVREQATSQAWAFPFCPTPPDWTLDWEGIQQRFSWIRSMAGVPQSPIYHAEGNVLLHTGMVAEALVKLAAWRQESQEERMLLFASALLHDVAKAQCTQIEGDGRITSRGHAVAGEKMARNILWTGSELSSLPVFAQREYIARLVRFHGLPLQFLDKLRPERQIIAASQSVRMDHVAMLAEADVRGRICADKKEMLECIELFRAFCKELQCYTHPRAFASKHSRFIYFQREQSDPDYAAYDDTTFEVVLMSGLPGAGKDTWLRTHLADWPILSLDEIRKVLKIGPGENQGHVIQVAKERARTLLRQQQSFAWNATNITRMMRQQLINLFVSYGAGNMTL